MRRMKGEPNQDLISRPLRVQEERSLPGLASVLEKHELNHKGCVISSQLPSLLSGSCGAQLNLPAQAQPLRIRG